MSTIERKGVLARDLLPDDKLDRGTVDKIETDGETTTITFRWTKDTLALWSGDHVWVDRAVVET